jgi:hypothetical protein
MNYFYYIHRTTSVINFKKSNFKKGEFQMLKIINENLFSFSSEECNNATYGDYTKLSIQTSRSVVAKMCEETQEFAPNIRIFARLISSEPDHTKFNLSYSTKMENEKVQLLLKSSPEVEKDSLIYLIAFPFNGIIKPIPESPNYRILKGMISVSEKYSVEYNDKKYKKVLYLAISPKVSVLNNSVENAYIPFGVEAYSYNKDKKGNSVTLRETLELKIKKDNAHSAKFITEEIEPVEIEEYKNFPIYTVYKRQNYESINKVVVVNNRDATQTRSGGGYTKLTPQDRKPYSKDTDETYPKKKPGGNPNRKKKNRK